MVDVNFECPRRAFVSFGDDWWNIQIGRDKLSWGNGHSGNLVIGDHLDHEDYARFTAFGNNMKYEALDIFLNHPTFVTPGEEDQNGIKMFLAHRLEFTPWRWLDFAISEDVMYQDDSINLEYLNPAFVYHNLNDRQNFNAIAHAEASVTPFPGLKVYGQFCLDQARAPLEGHSQPDCYGFIGGLEYGTALGPGLFDVSLEGAATTTYMYRRDVVDFIVLERYFAIDTSGGFVINGEYLGYQYGGGRGSGPGGLLLHHPRLMQILTPPPRHAPWRRGHEWPGCELQRNGHLPIRYYTQGHGPRKLQSRV